MTLISSIALAQDVESKWAVPIDASLVSSVEGKEIEKSFTPPITSIDSLGVCYAAAAATVINYEMCKLGKVQDCKGLPKSQRVSFVGLARYSSDTNKINKLDGSYDKLDIDAKGANGPRILSVATQRVIKLPTEECSSLESILSKNPIPDTQALKDAQIAIWENLRSDYDNYRKAIAEKCSDCASKYYQSATETVAKNLKIEEDQKTDANVKNDSLKVLEAFNKETFGEALNTLLYPKKCSETGISYPGYGKTQTETYPKNPKGIGRDQLLDQIKKVLANKQPILLDDVCTANCNSKDDAKMHSVVIAGYRKICKKSDPKSCRTALKIINNAGASWQDRNGGGWIESDNLLDSVKVNEASLSWLSTKM
jgi:hypothetical protein